MGWEKHSSQVGKVETGIDQGFSAKLLNESFRKNFDKLNCLTGDTVVTNEEFDEGMKLLDPEDQVKMGFIRKHSGIIKELSVSDMFGETGVSLRDMRVLNELGSYGQSWPATAIVRHQERHQMQLGGLGMVGGIAASMGGFWLGSHLIDRFAPPPIKNAINTAIGCMGLAGGAVLLADQLGNTQAKQMTKNMFDFMFVKPMEMLGHIGWSLGEQQANLTFGEHLDKLRPVMEELSETKSN